MIAKKFRFNVLRTVKDHSEKTEFTEMTMPTKLQREMPKDALKKACYISFRKP
jgi:hypothetical protein